MSNSVLRLPKWAQEMIRDLRNDRDRLQRKLRQSEDKTIKQCENNQALLDMLRNLRPDLFDKWNTGTSLEDLVEASRANCHNGG